MAVPPFDGLPGDGDEPADETALERDDAIEGTVVPFPGSPPPPAPRKAKFGEAAELRPILPEHLRTLAAARKHYGWHAKRARHHFLYHLVRLPARMWNTVRWAALGMLKVGWVQVNWWWLTEQAYLRSQAVRDNDPRTWESLHKHARKVRLVRGSVLGAELVALLVLTGTVTAYAPLAWAPIGLVVLPATRLVRPARRQADPHLGHRAGGVRAAVASRSSSAPWKASASAGSTRPSPRTARPPSSSSTRSSGTARAGWPGSTCRSV